MRCKYFIHESEKAKLDHLANEINESLLWGVPLPQVQGPRPLWDDAKFAYIMVNGKSVLALVLDDKAWKLTDGYDATGELYKKWNMIRFCRGMDL